MELLLILLVVALVLVAIGLGFFGAVAVAGFTLVFAVALVASIWVRRAGRRTAPGEEAARQFLARRV